MSSVAISGQMFRISSYVTSLAGQPLATPTAGRGESGKIPIIVSYLTRQEFLGVLSGFNGAAVAFQYTSMCA